MNDQIINILIFLSKYLNCIKYLVGMSKVDILIVIHLYLSILLEKLIIAIDKFKKFL